MTHTVPGHERDPTAAEHADRYVATRWPERRVEAEWAGIVEQRVEAGPADDADIGRWRDRAHSDDASVPLASALRHGELPVGPECVHDGE
jgi:hypothetical protein